MQEQQANIQGLKINYKEAGNGPCILILHGWGVDSCHWLKFQEIMAEKGYRVIIPDLPGFGRSDLPKKPWSLMDYVSFVKDFIEKLELEKFYPVRSLGNYNRQNEEQSHQSGVYLLGHSFGGRIATKFAVSFLQKLLGLILVSSAGVTPRNKFRIFSYRIFTKIGNLIFSLPFLKVSHEPARKLIYWAAGSRDFYQAKGIMKEVFRLVIAEDLTPYLQDIKIKTLIVWGKDDRMTPVSDAHIYHREINGSILNIIPDVGHSPNLKAPEKLAKIVSDFVR